MRRSYSVLLSLLLSSSCSTGTMEIEPEPEERMPNNAALTRWTAKSSRKVYEMTIQPSAGEIEIGKLHSWIIHLVTTSGIAVYPAKIVVGGGMKGHGHGMPTQPEVTAYAGHGDYLVEGVRFNMEGIWALSFFVESSFGNDRVDFEIVISF